MTPRSAGVGMLLVCTIGTGVELDGQESSGFGLFVMFSLWVTRLVLGW